MKTLPTRRFGSCKLCEEKEGIILLNGDWLCYDCLEKRTKALGEMYQLFATELEKARQPAAGKAGGL
jgi:hypothetical protein